MQALLLDDLISLSGSVTFYMRKLKGSNVICRNCKKEFYRSKSVQLKAINKENQFCSHDCRAEFGKQNRKPTTRAKTHDRHNCRIITEKILKRKLKKGEIVHHIDENEQNDNIENLAVLPSIRFHYDVHHANRQFEEYKLINIIKYGETTNPAPIINTCIRGHEFTETSTYYTKTGRGCRICVNAYIRQGRLRIKLQNEANGIFKIKKKIEFQGTNVEIYKNGIYQCTKNSIGRAAIFADVPKWHVTKIIHNKMDSFNGYTFKKQ